MASKKEYKERVAALRRFIDVQGQPGNYDMDQYMLGMYNGMVFALSVITNEEPVYKAASKDPVFEDLFQELPEQLTMDQELMQHKEEPLIDDSIKSNETYYINSGTVAEVSDEGLNIAEQIKDNSSPTKYFG
jgi:hypothetical protein